MPRKVKPGMPQYRNAQFNLCCTSTAFSLQIESGSGLTPVWCESYTLFLDPRNMSGGKLPTTVALDHCVRELHHSVEWFAVRCSFHARFSENNCRVISVKPRLHVVVFKYVVMDFPAAQLIDLVRTRAHFAIRERQRKIRREHTLQRGHVCVKKRFARIALELEHVLFIRGLRE